MLGEFNIPTDEAAKIAGVSSSTIRTWTKAFGIGKKIRGRYYISKTMLNKVLSRELYYPPKFKKKK